MTRVNVRAEGFWRGLGVTEKVIDLIREDEKTVFLRDGQELRAAFFGERVSAGVLEGGDDVNEFGIVYFVWTFDKICIRKWNCVQS